MALANLFHTSPTPACPAPPLGPSSPLQTGSSTRTGAATPMNTVDTSTRCRYKTGRCTNARVIKPNGLLLLLCEFHRDQQNRTKKRSDMKYRHHRATKRELDKRTLFRPFLPASRSQLQPLLSAPSTLKTMQSSSIGSDKQPLHSPHTGLTKSTVYKLSRDLRSADIGSCISPGNLRVYNGRSDVFLSSRRDIVAMASANIKVSLEPLSPVVLPVCPSPLQQQTSNMWMWHPEDLRLLAYFIL